MAVQPVTFGEPSPQGSSYGLFARMELSSSHDVSTTSLKGSAKKLHSEEELQAFCLRPRFEEQPLQRLLQDSVVTHTQNHVLDTPVEYYESLLYNCTRTYVDTLGGQPVTLSCLGDIHQIYALKQNEHYLDEQERLQLNDCLEHLLEEKPAVFHEYKLVKDLMELVAGLIVHFGLYSRQNYEYRQQARVVNAIENIQRIIPERTPAPAHVRTLDLVAINSKLQSMDTLWLAAVACKPPMNAYISETTRQLAMVLVCATETLFRFALRMNSVDFRQQPRIDSFLVSKQPQLQSVLHAEAGYFRVPPEYQELKIPTNFLAKCFKTRAQRNLETLRTLAVDQEYAFRAFEEAMLANFVV